MNVAMQTIAPEAYPSVLCEIPQVPKQLYIRGTVPDWSRHFVAVVGARQHTSYGKAVCEHIVAGLASYPVTVVSGLAIGLDGVAHAAALRVGLPTVAVLGSGLSDAVLYPKSNRVLAQQIIASGGTLVSELAPNARANRSTFPQRNRLIAGMSCMTIAVECARRAGTQITASLALEYNREVGAVPHSIFSAVGVGTNDLIARGAHVIRSGEDVAAVLGLI